MEYYSVIKKWNNDICSNTDGPRIVILSEASQRKKNIAWYTLYVESKNKWDKLTYLKTWNRLTDLVT